MKIFWLDVETTGLDANKHAMVQLACIIDAIDNSDQGVMRLDQLNLFIKPFKGDYINKDALKINNLTIQDFKTEKFLPPKEAFKTLIDFMSKYINPYNRYDKFIIGGKNIKFDINFLRRFFDKCNDSYYGSWFHYPSIDIESSFAEYMIHTNNKLKNYKLQTLCEHFDIEIDKSHDAMCDIEMTRRLYYEHLS